MSNLNIKEKVKEKSRISFLSKIDESIKKNPTSGKNFIYII